MFKLWISVTAVYTSKVKKFTHHPRAVTGRAGNIVKGSCMFELFGFSPLQDPFLKGITELKMTQALSKTALTCSSGLLSHPTDTEAGLGKNFAFPSPSSQGILCLHLSSPLHGGHRGGRSVSYSKKAKRDVEGSAPLGDDGQHQPWCQVQLQEEQPYTIRASCSRASQELKKLSW